MGRKFNWGRAAGGGLSALGSMLNQNSQAQYEAGLKDEQRRYEEQMQADRERSYLERALALQNNQYDLTHPFVLHGTSPAPAPLAGDGQMAQGPFLPDQRGTFSDWLKWQDHLNPPVVEQDPTWSGPFGYQHKGLGPSDSAIINFQRAGYLPDGKGGWTKIPGFVPPSGKPKTEAAPKPESASSINSRRSGANQIADVLFGMMKQGTTGEAAGTGLGLLAADDLARMGIPDPNAAAKREMPWLRSAFVDLKMNNPEGLSDAALADMAISRAFNTHPSAFDPVTPDWLNNAGIYSDSFDAGGLVDTNNIFSKDKYQTDKKVKAKIKELLTKAPNQKLQAASLINGLRQITDKEGKHLSDERIAEYLDGYVNDDLTFPIEGEKPKARVKKSVFDGVPDDVAEYIKSSGYGIPDKITPASDGGYDFYVKGKRYHIADDGK